MHYDHDRAPFVIALTASWLQQDPTQRRAALEVLAKSDCERLGGVTVRGQQERRGVRVHGRAGELHEGARVAGAAAASAAAVRIGNLHVDVRCWCDE